ncbi:uncharacterized protein BYT42DRAFT_615574 [Radiomyces spectabilis]|uniref:uncharacterized protein n=1 Tax=Radiomyces spectabilis TaxID=64574 RepID=UPI0022201B79|nr:uncharacterized protein BYT42DRAFT_615574 [Radiomyces spectabilis]KAI8374405.1 hypothetical protein BYT42DRAFT_615574 [Radiomyces spectabilis]
MGSGATWIALSTWAGTSVHGIVIDNLDGSHRQAQTEEEEETGTEAKGEGVTAVKGEEGAAAKEERGTKAEEKQDIMAGEEQGTEAEEEARQNEKVNDREGTEGAEPGTGAEEKTDTEAAAEEEEGTLADRATAAGKEGTEATGAREETLAFKARRAAKEVFCRNLRFGILKSILIHPKPLFQDESAKIRSSFVEAHRAELRFFLCLGTHPSARLTSRTPAVQWMPPATGGRPLTLSDFRQTKSLTHTRHNLGENS